MATIRYFAAAAAAAQVGSERRVADTLGALLDQLTDVHGEDFAKVLGRCSVLVDGARSEDRDLALAPTATVDILPPFAGG
ncbi:MAG TPA: MoaD/ThiS family protein [Propioniciclava tarda]|nr:MoaD/ThiS family protein [Propioniciclava tarda]HQA30930.1 MoaD/ThiS family protein [Propioniciclava tarda]HQD60393.1 MoaD/ThiS family protein [Propioniciclava tarda]